MTTDTLTVVADLVARAKRAGAEAADAIVVRSQSLSVNVRLGKLETVERSENRDLGLRVFFGKQQAMVSSTDFSSDGLSTLVERAVAMAKAAPEDKFCGLADPALLARDVKALDLADSYEPQAEELEARARETEEAARAVPGVTNSDGGSASWGKSEVALATSTGFHGGYAGTSHSLSASVVAGEGTAMETDYDYAVARHHADLSAAAAIGRSAGEKAVRRLNPQRMKTRTAPVVFDPRVSSSMLGHLAGAVSGGAIARGTSFLKDRLGQPVCGAGIQIIDDPHRARGLASKPFDGEGVANRRTSLVENGILTTWLLDSATARQLGLTSTGHAARGNGGPPGPSTTNLYLAPGTVSPAELIADIADGLYVTDLIGFGVNGVTGDYSRGAAGFWIKNGEITFPVSEITIAGNLKDMFQRLVPANDLAFRFSTNAPTLRIDGMTIAGS